MEESNVRTNPSTELAAKPSEELMTQEAELAAAALEGVEQRDLVLPVLQVTQQLSKAVTEDGHEAGHFVNSLTGEDHGAEVDLIVVHFFKGRFLPSNESPDGRNYAAAGSVAPSNWPSEYAGKPFADIPDAEESYRERVQEEEIEWGGGPPIRTTYNFVGFLPDEPGVPVRLSLMRTSVPAARKIITLLRFARAPWDSTVRLDTDLRHSKRDQPFYVVNATKGRQTTAEERQAAVALAGDVRQAQISLAGDDALDESADKRRAAEKSDGLDVA